MYVEVMFLMCSREGWEEWEECVYVHVIFDFMLRVLYVYIVRIP